MPVIKDRSDVKVGPFEKKYGLPPEVIRIKTGKCAKRFPKNSK